MIDDKKLIDALEVIKNECDSHDIAEIALSSMSGRSMAVCSERNLPITGTLKK